MESIKKLEEQLVMNQKKHGSEKITNGPEDDGSDVTTIKEVFGLYSRKKKKKKESYIYFSVLFHLVIYCFA